MKFFSPPIKSQSKSFFEEARYILSYRIFLFLTISLGTLTLLTYSLYSTEFGNLTLAGFLPAAVCFFIVRKTGKYKNAMLFFNLFAAILCLTTMYNLPMQPHIADMLWMFINISLAFYTIPKIYGFLITAVHVVATVIFYSLYYNDQMHLLQSVEPHEFISLGANIACGFSILAYLNWQNVKTTEMAEKKINQANTMLSNQNIEKTLMLKEIHHRVKNNLQVIISLLRLQSAELTNKDTKEKFQDTINRIIAMSLVHEKMYQSEELSNLILKDYFQKLGDDITYSFELENDVELNIETDLVSSNVKSIIPIGLIFNELLTNSMKHAFSNAKGEINFKLYKEDNNIIMSYSDNGTWKTSKNASSFGLELIDMMTNQLSGELIFKQSPTTYTFTFNIDSI